MDCATDTLEITSFLDSLSWSDLNGETVMDMGCGLGNTSTQCILTKFPRLGRLIAVDKNETCIRESRAKFNKGLFKKAEYHLANIAYMRHLRRWKGKISKIVSAFCLSEIKKKEQAFKIMFDLLKPGGQAALYFTDRIVYDEVLSEMKKEDKWAQYLEDINEVPATGSTTAYYEEVLKQQGFKVIMCENQMMINCFSNTDLYKAFADSMWERDIMEKIPKEKHVEFMGDVHSHFLNVHPSERKGLFTFTVSRMKILVEKAMIEEVV